MSKEQQTKPVNDADFSERPSSALATIQDAPAGVSSLGDVMNTGQLKSAIKTAETQRQLIKDFVKNQLVDGVDYGVIVGGKPTLLKPGQEKIFSLMKLTSRLEKDTDTIEMLGSEPGTVAYLCRVYRGGEEIAQGRGAAIVGDKKRDANSTIKIAEKRARMDACLSLGFSEFFTQDMDDPDYRDRGNNNAGAAAPEARPASDKQKQFIMDLFKQKGITAVIATIKANDIENPSAMTGDQASALIEALKADTFKRPAASDDTDQTPPADEGSGSSADVEPTEGEIVDEKPAEPVVDQAFKAEVDTMFAELDYDNISRMRLCRKLNGMPNYPKTDHGWRKLHNHLQKEIETKEGTAEND